MDVRRETFFVGGAYTGEGSARVMQGQMFVEALSPEQVLYPYPLVLIHGGGQTPANWLTTPDGRPGWAEWFSRRGWRVHLVDAPGRGRSARQPDAGSRLQIPPLAWVERTFTAPEAFDSWPQAKLHTQWPGGPNKGRAGDPVFDQFYASQVATPPRQENETLMLAAGVALLERIGPSILIAHSQGSVCAWSIADARPELVQGIVALEPTGPPFKDPVGRPGAEDRLYGLTSISLTYDPPVAPESPLVFEQQAAPDAPGLAACWMQAGPPRRLVNLAGLKVLVVTGEASYHAAYDHCTVAYLRAAGVEAELVHLPSVGIHGNGHMLMLEKNSDEIAEYLSRWMSKHIL